MIKTAALLFAFTLGVSLSLATLSCTQMSDPVGMQNASMTADNGSNTANTDTNSCPGHNGGNRGGGMMGGGMMGGGMMGGGMMGGGMNCDMSKCTTQMMAECMKGNTSVCDSVMPGCCKKQP